MLIRNMAVLAILLSVVGCASTETVRLADNAGASLTGKQLHSTREAPPSFLALTATHGAFAVVGVAGRLGVGCGGRRDDRGQDERRRSRAIHSLPNLWFSAMATRR